MHQPGTARVLVVDDDTNITTLLGRLMRREGPPYTQVELVRAREFTAYLRAIYQALVPRHEAGKAIPAIKAFSKDWYAKHAQ